ncbi:MAG: archease [Melioribacteraceae bacterium]|nr:archease [Melioribacteraceae bacterium]
MSFKLIDHTADIAMVVDGNSIEELFISACNGWKFITIENSNDRIESSKKFLFNGNSYEELLIELINELNFQLLVKKFVFTTVNKITFSKFNSSIQLDIEIFGQRFNYEKHLIKEEIKAVTFHQMKIVNEKGLFTTKIVFDI